MITSPRSFALGALTLFLCVPRPCAAEDFHPSDERAGRIAAEGGGALAGTVVGGLAGGGLGCLFDGGNDREWGCLAPGLIGAGIGATVGIGAGVYLGGNLSGANGGLGWTILGESIGLAAAIATLVISELKPSPLLIGTLAYLMPVAGAIIGYELSTSVRIEATDDSSAPLTGSGFGFVF